MKSSLLIRCQIGNTSRNKTRYPVSYQLLRRKLKCEVSVPRQEGQTAGHFTLEFRIIGVLRPPRVTLEDCRHLHWRTNQVVTKQPHGTPCVKMSPISSAWLVRRASSPEEDRCVLARSSVRWRVSLLPVCVTIIPHHNLALATSRIISLRLELIDHLFRYGSDMSKR